MHGSAGPAHTQTHRRETGSIEAAAHACAVILCIRSSLWLLGRRQQLLLFLLLGSPRPITSLHTTPSSQWTRTRVLVPPQIPQMSAMRPWSCVTRLQNALSQTKQAARSGLVPGAQAAKAKRGQPPAPAGTLRPGRPALPRLDQQPSMAAMLAGSHLVYLAQQLALASPSSPPASHRHMHQHIQPFSLIVNAIITHFGPLTTTLTSVSIVSTTSSSHVL